MKKEIAILLFVFIGCTTTKTTIKPDNKISRDNSILTGAHMYKIYKVDSINNYYILYAKKNDYIFKIISKKEVNLNCNAVKMNGSYNLNLKSVWEYDTVINNKKISFSKVINVNCLGLNDSTTICLERDSINDLHYAENLRGLCLNNP